MIIDNYGATAENIDGELLTSIAGLLKRHYPGRVHNLIVFPFSSRSTAFKLGWAALKRALPRDAVARATLLESSQRAELLRYVDRSSLPKHMGGVLPVVRPGEAVSSGAGAGARPISAGAAAMREAAVVTT